MATTKPKLELTIIGTANELGLREKPSLKVADWHFHNERLTSLEATKKLVDPSAKIVAGMMGTPKGILYPQLL